MKKIFILSTALALLSITSSIWAGPHDQKVHQLLQEEIQKWLDDPTVINAITRQNQTHISLSQAEIENLDKKWRAERKKKAQPMINQVLGNSLSNYLKSIKIKSDGLYSEIFIMDNKGLNVGQSNVTSDYWQGDEAKWQKTYLAGTDAIFIDNIKYDKSAKGFQVQVSVPVVNKNTNTNIGAVTIGISMRKLVLREIKL